MADKIIVERYYNPTKIRGWDFMARFEWEDGYGFGATEAEAIRDLCRDAQEICGIQDGEDA